MNLPKGIDKTNARDAKGVIRWQFIDPWLRAASQSGDLVQLAAHLGLHKNTLAARRKAIGCGPLRLGRPATAQPFPPVQTATHGSPGFTDKELRERILRERERAPVQGTHAHHIATRCLTCTGLGLVKSQADNRGHHVCDDCLGTGRASKEESNHVR